MTILTQVNNDPSYEQKSSSEKPALKKVYLQTCHQIKCTLSTAPTLMYSCIELSIIHQVGTLSHPSFEHSKVHFVILDNFMQHRHYLNFLHRGGNILYCDLLALLYPCFRLLNKSIGRLYFH